VSDITCYSKVVQASQPASGRPECMCSGKQQRRHWQFYILPWPFIYLAMAIGTIGVREATGSLKLGTLSSELNNWHLDERVPAKTAHLCHSTANRLARLYTAVTPRASAPPACDQPREAQSILFQLLQWIEPAGPHLPFAFLAFFWPCTAFCMPDMDTFTLASIACAISLSFTAWTSSRSLHECAQSPSLARSRSPAFADVQA
jgi:hypothetical protein